jgi:PAS domain S-box-containing protein
MLNLESPAKRYAAAAGATLLAIAVRLWLSPVLGERAPFGLLLLAILFSAAVGGYGPAVFSMGLGALAVAYRLTSADVDGSAAANHFVSAVFYFLVGGAIAAVAGRLRATQQAAQQALIELSRQREHAGEMGRRLEAALDAGATATWTWDIANNRVQGDKNLARLFAMSLDDSSSVQVERFFQAIHAEDRQRLLMTTMQALDTMGEYEVDFRVFQPDGSFRWVISRGRVECDDNGQASRLTGLLVDITERKLAGEALRESEERLRTLTEAAPGVVWTSLPSGRVDYANQQWFDLTGQTPEQLYGSELAWLEAAHPDDRQRASQTFQQAVAAGEPFEMEIRFRRASDGSHRWYLSRAVPMRNVYGAVAKYFGTCADIEDYRRVEARLAHVTEQSEQRRRVYETALSSTMDLIYVFDLEGRFTYANQALLSLWRRTWDDAIGKTCLELGYLPDHAAMHDREIQQVIQTRQPIRGEVPFEGAHGLRTYEYIFVPVIGSSGQVVAVAGSTRDMTERRQLEDNLRQSAADLSEADRRKDEFLATLAHELRNPLAPLRNALEVMRLTGDDPATVAESRQIMERQLAQMVRLVDDLLDLSRITRNRLELRTERLELSAVLASAIETSRPLVESSRHELTVSLPERPIYLQADVTRLAQVFSNLLNNGAKYTPAGGRIWLLAAVEGDQIEVRVRDTGIGISANSLPKVFEMFAQVDGSHERAQGGLGIGLTLVKRLVTMHGGSIEANSAGLGQGSEFIVRLPFDPSLQPQKMEPKPASSSSATATPKRRILVVDDNVDAAKTLGIMLTIMGNETCLAHDGAEAVAKAASFQPEIILLDLGLPNINGFEACQMIRRQPGAERIVIVALTGWGQEEDKYRTKEAGFDDHFVKPIEPARLHRLVAALPDGPAS